MNKITGIIIGIIILAFGGLVIWSVMSSGSESVNFDNYDAATVIGPNADNGEIGDHVEGNAESPVVVIEYGDFQCAGCATTHPKVATLVEEYGDRVAFVFRNFPITGHQNARAAASAAEAGGVQGYFAEMVNIIYANQATWSYASGTERTNIFTELFMQVFPEGDSAQFKSDMGSSEVAKKIAFDYGLGLNGSKVVGTPSFFINGVWVDLSESSTTSDFLQSMRAKIDAQLSVHNLPVGATAIDSENEEE